MQTQFGNHSAVLRYLAIGVATVTAVMAILGLMQVLEHEALAFALFVLIPPGLLACLIRQPVTVLICSAITLLLSSLPWALVALGDDDWMGLVIVGYPVVTIACVVGAVIDDRNRKETADIGGVA